MPDGDLAHGALHKPRKPTVREKVAVDDMVGRFMRGQPIKELAHEYSISESSVKRLLRATEAKRRQR